jgi:hypothetical protein
VWVVGRHVPARRARPHPPGTRPVRRSTVVGRASVGLGARNPMRTTSTRHAVSNAWSVAST